MTETVELDCGMFKHQASGNDEPLRVMFVNTHLSVGGAETLLANLIRGMDRDRFAPELCCLKHLGPLGEELAAEVPAFSGLLRNKRDLFVIQRLGRLMRQRHIDAVVTVGTGGDKMFWGRLAAWRAGVPVVLSALHSTGLPDHVERPNRLLARWTDGFIAVAETHAQYLAQAEGCPRNKVFVVPNGVDVEAFAPRPPDEHLRRVLGLREDQPLAIIVAALRPEKNHALFLHAAARVSASQAEARFLIVGDGPCRGTLENLASSLHLKSEVQFLGVRSDIAKLLALSSVAVLTSKMEANPVALLEAMATTTPVVATRVGSVPETVLDGQCGFLVPPDDVETLAKRIEVLFADRSLAEGLGQQARAHVVANWSLDRMIHGYEDLITTLYRRKRGGVRPSGSPAGKESIVGSVEVAAPL